MYSKNLDMSWGIFKKSRETNESIEVSYYRTGTIGLGYWHFAYLDPNYIYE